MKAKGTSLDGARTSQDVGCVAVFLFMKPRLEKMTKCHRDSEISKRDEQGLSVSMQMSRTKSATGPRDKRQQVQLSQRAAIQGRVGRRCQAAS